MTELFTCALAQLSPVLFETQTNLRRAKSVIEEAAGRGARLVAFPELFLTGYFLRDRIRSLAEAVDGPSVSSLAETAKSEGTVVLMGFPEISDETVYNSVAVINADGEILGSYRKTHLYDTEYRYFVAGDEFPVFKTDIGVIGVQICFDLEYPEVSRTLALKGAQLLICASANMLPFQRYQDVYWQARAMENHVIHALVNRVGQEEETIFFGESGIASPLGNIIAKAASAEEIVYGECAITEIEEATALLDYFNQRRPELYRQLTVK